MENTTTKAPRKVQSVDGLKDYENRLKEIEMHNRDLLESIIGACPEKHVIVLSQTTQEIDPCKWIEGKMDVGVSGIYAFVHGANVDKALATISADSVIRKFWFVQFEF